MEAMVAEKGAEMTEWNDGRLDDLSDRVDRIETKIDSGFVQADQKVEAGFARVDDRFKETDQKMEAGFARLDKKMEAGFARVDATFARVDARLDELNGSLIRGMWTFGVGMLAFAGSLLGIMATKF